MSGIDPERWRVVFPYLDEALELTDETRAGWLAALRARDGGLAADIDQLLVEHELLRRNQFLEEAIVHGPDGLLGHLSVPCPMYADGQPGPERGPDEGRKKPVPRAGGDVLSAPVRRPSSEDRRR